MDLLTFLHNLDGGDILAISIGIASLVEISPIKINPWTWLSKAVAHAMGISELRKDIERIRNDMNELDQKIINLKTEEKESRDLREALRARRRIITFNDELLQGIRHSKEMYDDILSEDMKTYDNYCHANPNFVNQKCVMSESNIKKSYQECMDNHSFL